MEIAFVLDRFRPAKGGLEAWLSAFGPWLAERGHSLHLVTRDRGLVSPPFQHHPLPGRGLTRSGRDRRFAEEARELCGRLGLDVVVGLRHCLCAHVYYPHGGSAAATFAGRSSRKAETLVALEREFLEGEEPPRTVVAVSELVRRDLSSRYPAIADRIVVVPNGVDLSRFTPRGRKEARERLAPEQGRVLLFAAGNPALKGWSTAREVFTRLRVRGLANRLLAIGGKPRGLPEGAVWLGRLDRPEEAYRAADLLLHPTRYDPFPLTVLEALACGTPVLTTERNGAVDHLGRDGPVRAVEDPEDVVGLGVLAEEMLALAPREDARRLAEGFGIEGSLAGAERAVVEAGS